MSGRREAPPMLEALGGLLAIESVAEHGKEGLPFGPGPARALEYTLSLCEALGFRVKNAGGLYGYAEAGQGEKVIGVLSHLDVVPAGNGWTVPPFAGTVRDGRLYGRGSVDDKGPAVVCTYALRDLLDAYGGRPLPKRVRLIFGQTEENGDWLDMEAYLREEGPVDYGFTPDGDFPAIYCEKGVLVLTLAMPQEASGLLSAQGGTAPNIVPDFCRAETASGSHSASGKPAHGSAPWEGENAIDRLMEQLAREDVPFAKAYQALFGGDVYGKKLGIAARSPESGPLSLNVGMLRVQEGQARLTIDIRHPETQSAQEVAAQVEAAVKPYGFQIQPYHPLRPVFLDRKGAVMERLLSAYREEIGDCSEPLAIGGGTYARAMDNIIAFGPNFPGEESREHQADEYITLENLERLRRIYRRALENLLEME